MLHENRNQINELNLQLDANQTPMLGDSISCGKPLANLDNLTQDIVLQLRKLYVDG